MLDITKDIRFCQSGIEEDKAKVLFEIKRKDWQSVDRTMLTYEVIDELIDERLLTQLKCFRSGVRRYAHDAVLQALLDSPEHTASFADLANVVANLLDYRRKTPYLPQLIQSLNVQLGRADIMVAIYHVGFQPREKSSQLLNKDKQYRLYPIRKS